MEGYFHSVRLDRDKCKGCTNCLKHCPTQAIRIRDGKASIISERCIDCGECIRVCEYHAKQPVYDPLSIIENYKYSIALPAPSLYGQFNNLDNVEIIIEALKRIGFNDVFEVSVAAEIISQVTRRLLLAGKLKKPVISTACPAVLRIIRVRFPEFLKENILPLHSPMELAARLAKQMAAEKTGLAPEEIGAIFISPCPAKMTAVKMPMGTEKSAVDGVVAIKEIYPRLVAEMKNVTQPAHSAVSGAMGIGWSASGGESENLLTDNYLAADGIENVIKVLEVLEDERFNTTDFVELNSCAGGCVGGVLNVENPYVAKVKIKKIKKFRPLSGILPVLRSEDELIFDKAVEFLPVMALDESITGAMDKFILIDEIENRLSGIDCGSCGAPSCRALAEDVVAGLAKEEDCIFVLRERMQDLIDRSKKEPTA